MYMQRLIADSEIGFNYDHMGSAEFEGGATRDARLALAKLMIDKEISVKRVQLFEHWGRSERGPVEVYVFSTKDYISKLTHELVITPTKQSMRLDDSHYAAWMRVDRFQRDDFVPLLIVRCTVNLSEADKFIDPAIAFLDDGQI